MSPTLGGLALLLGESAGHFYAVPFAGLACDHRNVHPGFVFFAMPGTRVDGAQFITAAVAAGAIAVVGAKARPANLSRTVLYLRSRDMRLALSRAAAYAFPRQPRTIVAVTGTAGKTSVAEFTRQVFEALGYRAASLGTLGLIGPDGADKGALTTPDPITLHRTLERLAQGGVTHLAMEASSHGLEQARLDGVRLAAAGFTNLGRDHLDYHADIERYFKAKMRLFEALLPPQAPAVINFDGDRASEAAVAADFSGHPVFTSGARGRDVVVKSITPVGFGQDVEVEYRGRPYTLKLPLMGEFQVENALLAASFALALGEAPAQVFAALEQLKGVRGRLERVGAFNAAPVFVDYAHKPEALEHALCALRPFVSGKLVLVFGCGGDRDAGKRPLMGQIARRCADLVFVTDDNPRSEEPAAIRAQILAGCPGAIEIADRAAAIHASVLRLDPGDALLIAGKGHESGQITKGVTYPFSDHEVARAAIEGIT